MKIGQLAGGSGEQTPEAIRTLAVAEFTNSFIFANYAEFYQISGNADSPRKAGSDMSAGENRAINDDYTPLTNDPDFAAAVLKIYGGQVKTDIAYERRGLDIGSQRVLDLQNFVRSLARKITDALINDTLSAKKISGFKEQATTLLRKIVFDTVNGGSVPTGNGNTERKQQDKFIEWLDAQIEDIADGPTVMVCNGAFKARMASIGRGYTTFSNVADIYGNSQSVQMYRDVPIVNAGFKNDNSGLVIPSNETEGENSDCTSVYLVKFGEGQDSTIATNRGLDVKDLGKVSVAYHTLCEIDMDLVITNTKSFKRLSGIRL